MVLMVRMVVKDHKVLEDIGVKMVQMVHKVHKDHVVLQLQLNQIENLVKM